MTLEATTTGSSARNDSAAANDHASANDHAGANHHGKNHGNDHGNDSASATSSSSANANASANASASFDAHPSANASASANANVSGSGMEASARGASEDQAGRAQAADSRAGSPRHAAGVDAGELRSREAAAGARRSSAGGGIGSGGGIGNDDGMGRNRGGAIGAAADAPAARDSTARSASMPAARNEPTASLATSSSRHSSGGASALSQGVRDELRASAEQLAAAVVRTDSSLRSAPDLDFTVTKINIRGSRQPRVVGIRAGGVLNMKKGNESRSARGSTGGDGAELGIGMALGGAPSGRSFSAASVSADAATLMLSNGTGAASPDVVVTIPTVYSAPRGLKVTKTLLYDDVTGALLDNHVTLRIRMRKDHDFVYESPTAPVMLAELLRRQRLVRTLRRLAAQLAAVRQALGTDAPPLPPALALASPPLQTASSAASTGSFSGSGGSFSIGMAPASGRGGLGNGSATTSPTNCSAPTSSPTVIQPSPMLTGATRAVADKRAKSFNLEPAAFDACGRSASFSSSGFGDGTPAQSSGSTSGTNGGAGRGSKLDAVTGSSAADRLAIAVQRILYDPAAPEARRRTRFVSTEFPKAVKDTLRVLQEAAAERAAAITRAQQAAAAKRAEAAAAAAAAARSQSFLSPAARTPATPPPRPPPRPGAQPPPMQLSSDVAATATAGASSGVAPTAADALPAVSGIASSPSRKPAPTATGPRRSLVPPQSLQPQTPQRGASAPSNSSSSAAGALNTGLDTHADGLADAISPRRSGVRVDTVRRSRMTMLLRRLAPWRSRRSAAAAAATRSGPPKLERQATGPTRRRIPPPPATPPPPPAPPLPPEVARSRGHSAGVVLDAPPLDALPPPIVAASLAPPVPLLWQPGASSAASHSTAAAPVTGPSVGVPPLAATALEAASSTAATAVDASAVAVAVHAPGDNSAQVAEAAEGTRARAESMARMSAALGRGSLVSPAKMLMPPPPVTAVIQLRELIDGLHEHIMTSHRTALAAVRADLPWSNDEDENDDEVVAAEAPDSGAEQNDAPGEDASRGDMSGAVTHTSGSAPRRASARGAEAPPADFVGIDGEPGDGQHDPGEDGAASVARDGRKASDEGDHTASAATSVSDIVLTLVEAAFFNDGAVRRGVDACMAALTDVPTAAALARKMTALRTKPQSFFGIPLHLQQPDDWLGAVLELREIEQVATPSERLAALLASAAAVFDSYAARASARAVADAKRRASVDAETSSGAAGAADAPATPLPTGAMPVALALHEPSTAAAARRSLAAAIAVSDDLIAEEAARAIGGAGWRSRASIAVPFPPLGEPSSTFLSPLSPLTSRAPLGTSISGNGGSSGVIAPSSPGGAAFIAPLGADEFFPIHVFVVVRAQLAAPLALVESLWACSNPRTLVGQAGYYVTVFQAALAHIVELDVNE